MDREFWMGPSFPQQPRELLNRLKSYGVCVVADALKGFNADVEELRAHGWPVFAAAVVPCAADSDGPGQLNHPISCGGVPVHPGDIILADDNGVAVIPPTWVEWVLEGCEKRHQSEARRMAEIRQGQLTSAAELGSWKSWDCERGSMISKLERLLSGGTVTWDRLLVTDGLSPGGSGADHCCLPAAPDRARVVIDHDTPLTSVAVAEKQKALLDWARQTGAVFRSGRGIGYALLLESGLREGEIVLPGGAHAAAVGAPARWALSSGGAGRRAGERADPLSRPAAAAGGDRPAFLSLRPGSGLDPDPERPVQRKSRGHPGAEADRRPGHGPVRPAGRRRAVTALCVREDFPADETVDLTALQPMAAPPGDAARVVPAGETDGLRVNQVFIGGCGGGSLEALRETADLWRGRTVCPYVRVMVAPATSSVYVQALEEGLLRCFLDAGALGDEPGLFRLLGPEPGAVRSGGGVRLHWLHQLSYWAGRAHSGICLTTVRRAAQAAVRQSLGSGSAMEQTFLQPHLAAERQYRY